MRGHLRYLFTLVLCAMLLNGCARSVELLHELSEADANEIIAALRTKGITADKKNAKKGFSVVVPESELARSITTLNTIGLPRRTFVAMGDVFKKEGMVSTPVEERARYLYALSQELEKTLSQIDGVLLARVHPVLPERIAPGEAIMPASCSVFIKHVPGWDSVEYEGRIRRLVISSIPSLHTNAVNGAGVSIVFVASDKAPPGVQANRGEGAISRGEEGGKVNYAIRAFVWLLAVAFLSGATLVAHRNKAYIISLIQNLSVKRKRNG